MSPPGWVSARRAAELLGVSRGLLTEAARHGRLPAAYFQIGRGKPKYAFDAAGISGDPALRCVEPGCGVLTLGATRFCAPHGAQAAYGDWLGALPDGWRPLPTAAEQLGVTPANLRRRVPKIPSGLVRWTDTPLGRRYAFDIAGVETWGEAVSALPAGWAYRDEALRALGRTGTTLLRVPAVYTSVTHEPWGYRRRMWNVAGILADPELRCDRNGCGELTFGMSGRCKAHGAGQLTARRADPP